jgi:DNA-binding transcriptional ArsR family regulator
MVEYSLSLDSIFGSLADPTRRDILRRIAEKELPVSEIAQPYNMSLAAISKHLKILTNAKLVMKRRKGKQQFISLSPAAFKDAETYLRQYGQQINRQFDALEKYLSEEKAKE